MRQYIYHQITHHQWCDIEHPLEQLRVQQPLHYLQNKVGENVILQLIPTVCDTFFFLFECFNLSLYISKLLFLFKLLFL